MGTAQKRISHTLQQGSTHVSRENSRSAQGRVGREGVTGRERAENRATTRASSCTSHGTAVTSKKVAQKALQEQTNKATGIQVR
jgi:hypothetical protein